MEINFDKKCIKKALSYLNELKDYTSFTILLDLKRIDKEINNPFSDITNKGYLDAEFRYKYYYINDFEKLLKNYSFLFHDKNRISKYTLKYWDNRLKIDYYAIIGYALLHFSLINSIEDYIANEKGNEVFIRG